MNTRVCCIATDVLKALKFIHKQFIQKSDPVQLTNTAVIVTTLHNSPDIYWLTQECFKRAVIPVIISGADTDTNRDDLKVNIESIISRRTETDPLSKLNIYRDIPTLAGKNVLIISFAQSIYKKQKSYGCVGLVVSSRGNIHIPTFTISPISVKPCMAENIQFIFDKVAHLKLKIQECIVFQEGVIDYQLKTVKSCLPQGCELSFLMLNLLTDIRFTHKSTDNLYGNTMRGVVVQTLTPANVKYTTVAPSFYIQSHDCDLSTPRIVLYNVHHMSSKLKAIDLQRIAYLLAHGGVIFKGQKRPITNVYAKKLSQTVAPLLETAPRVSL